MIDECIDTQCGGPCDVPYTVAYRGTLVSAQHERSQPPAAAPNTRISTEDPLTRYQKDVRR